MEDLFRYYDLGTEAGRLAEGTCRLELVRTQEILQRFLPPPPAVILDVGAGPGVYAGWLARRGHEVHLIDPIPRHVEEAMELSRRQPAHPLASAVVGDARRIDRPDGAADAVLLLGPLYHLVRREDRVAALREAGRVLRPGGVVAAAAISRFASALDGMVRGFLEDPAFAAIVRRDLRDGQHRNTAGIPCYFTTAYFHRPGEIAREILEAGLAHEATLAVEGPAWMLQDFDRWWDDPARRERLLETVRLIESEPALLGASAHWLAVARRPTA